LRRAAPVALALVLLAGCGGSGPGPGPGPGPSATPRPPTDEELIARELERRAHGLELRVHGLGVRRPAYDVERLEVRGRRADVRARLSYRVAGVGGDFGSRRSLVAHRRGGRWRLSGPLGDRDAEPWEVDDYGRVRTPHFVIWAPDGIEPPVDALETGYERLGDALRGEDLERRYLVVLARDGDRARSITRRIEGLESLTALTDTQVSIGGPAERVREVRSQRLIIVASAFAQTDPASQEQVITHELSHAVLAPQTSTRTPAWLTEGIAMYVSGDDRRGEYFALAAVPTLAGLAAPDAIGRLVGEAQRAGYATASAAAFFIADRYGDDALLDLLDAFNSPRLRGVRGDPALTDRAMRRVLGVGLEEFQRMLG
jgi:hypothetical protein